MKRPARKLSLNEQKVENRKGETYWASMHGKELREDAPMPKEKVIRVKSEIPTESQEQRAFIKWWRLQYPAIRIFAIPNGGAREVITAAIMKAEGVTPGIPDLYVPRFRLWIEMKRTVNNRSSPEQLDWHNYLIMECKDSVIVAPGYQSAIDQIKLFMKYREGK